VKRAAPGEVAAGAGDPARRSRRHLRLALAPTPRDERLESPRWFWLETREGARRARPRAAFSSQRCASTRPGDEQLESPRGIWVELCAWAAGRRSRARRRAPRVVVLAGGGHRRRVTPGAALLAPAPSSPYRHSKAGIPGILIDMERERDPETPRQRSGHQAGHVVLEIGPGPSMDDGRQRPPLLSESHLQGAPPISDLGSCALRERLSAPMPCHQSSPHELEKHDKTRHIRSSVALIVRHPAGPCTGGSVSSQIFGCCGKRVNATISGT
jgi:hypothetical protein